MLGFKLDTMEVGTPTCPNLKRWRFVAPGGMSVRLHHWLRDDLESHTHEHAWAFVTIVLWGGYTDLSRHWCGGSAVRTDGNGFLYCGRCGVSITPYGANVVERLRAGSVRYRGPGHRHCVVDCAGCWSLILTGPNVRPWRFWIDGKLADPHVWNDRVCD